MTYLSKNFTLEQMLRSTTATRLGMNEQWLVEPQIINNLKNLCQNILEPLQSALALPITITSGYRCEKLNKLIGGSATSDHCKGLAADTELYIDEKENNLYLAKEFLRLNIPFKQLIMEFGESIEKPAWVHLSYDSANNKGQILRASIIDGKTMYAPIKQTDIMLL